MKRKSNATIPTLADEISAADADAAKVVIDMPSDSKRFATHTSLAFADAVKIALATRERSAPLPPDGFLRHVYRLQSHHERAKKAGKAVAESWPTTPGARFAHLAANSAAQVAGLFADCVLGGVSLMKHEALGFGIRDSDVATDDPRVAAWRDCALQELRTMTIAPQPPAWPSWEIKRDAQVVWDLLNDEFRRVTEVKVQLQLEYSLLSSLQNSILTALDGKVMKTRALADKVRVAQPKLYRGKNKPGGIEELKLRGLVKLNNTRGYYRPDAPPLDAIPIGIN